MWAWCTSQTDVQAAVGKVPSFLGWKPLERDPWREKWLPADLLYVVTSFFESGSFIQQVSTEQQLCAGIMLDSWGESVPGI